MSRTYLRAAGLTAVGLVAAGLSQKRTARALFNSAAVPEEQFAVLAQRIDRAQWKPLVLEQIKTQPHCWTAREQFPDPAAGDPLPPLRRDCHCDS